MEIGGYPELELPEGEEYYNEAMRLNTGRSAFEYLLRTKNYKKVYLPLYTCDVMLKPVQNLALSCEFYRIDATFRPLFDFSRVGPDDVFVYTNYFGICDRRVEEVTRKCRNIIIDNSQAFYSKPPAGTDTFNSPRKFFGVPDGAYLFTGQPAKEPPEQDVSYRRFEHLLGRIDLGAAAFYGSFQENNRALADEPVKAMSRLTQRMLRGIDYRRIAEKRRENFLFLHAALKTGNQLQPELQPQEVPLVYPYLTSTGAKLKKKLITRKIFVPTYWPNVLETALPGSTEFHLAENTVFLPVDQRYNNREMRFILESIQEEAQGDSPKVTIRELRPEDAEKSWKWRNDPEVWMLTGRKWNNPVDRETEETWIREAIRQPDSRRFAICVGDRQEYVGNVQLTNITENEAMLHLFIGEKQYWGKGVGTIATALLLEYAKTNLALKEIRLLVKKNNRPAIRIYQKAGFIVSHEVEDNNYLMIYSYES